MKREGRTPTRDEDVCSACEVQEDCEQNVDQMLDCANDLIHELVEHKTEWDVYSEAMLEAARHPDRIQEIIGPLIGQEFRTPDGKIRDTITGVTDHRVQIRRGIVLDKPADFMHMVFTQEKG